MVSGVLGWDMIRPKNYTPIDKRIQSSYTDGVASWDWEPISPATLRTSQPLVISYGLTLLLLLIHVRSLSMVYALIIIRGMR